MGVTTVRPASSSTFVSAFTVTGAASVHAALNDNLDSSYVSTGPSEAFDGALITLGDTGSLAAGAVASRVRLRVRAFGLGFGAVVGAGVFGAHGETTLTWGTPTTTTLASVAVTTWPDETAEVAQLYMNAPGAYSGYITEFYVDCYYVAKPVCDVLSPISGTYTDRNTVEVLWANSYDTEGGGQDAYQVKIFDDAHYPANQAAMTSATDYDDTSGIVEGSSATSWQSTLPLANDGYKAHVRTAQRVNGTLHWSDWDVGGEFTINVTAAPTPTLSVSDDAANGRISISVNSGGATTHIIEIQRSYDGGTTWEHVRTEEGDGIISDWSATPDLYDYEAPNGTAASYRARAGRLYTSFYAYSAWTSTASDTWTSTAYWLKHPTDPTLNEAFVLKASGTIERGGRAGVHQPLGDSQAIAVSDLPGNATGEFEIFAHTEADRAPLEALLESGAVLLFQSPSAAALDDRWIIPGGWSRTRVVDHSGYPREVYAVPWSEVATPEGNLE